MSETNYPSKFLKGAPNMECFDADNNIMQYGAWEKWDLSEGKKGFEESSINWWDDDNALEELKQKVTERKGIKCQQFQGCFVLSTKELQKCVKKHEKLLTFGRAPVLGNRFHGNIYRKEGLPKQTKITLMSQLSNAFIEFLIFQRS